jgi:hypothetical protein
LQRYILYWFTGCLCLGPGVDKHWMRSYGRWDLSLEEWSLDTKVTSK